ncbi:MAG: hypothetical protein Ta2E_12180 [Mycoplasmoidaceae bacterium]|nr:MAG: hypothetical protein Ta2E_12180 [Mycoplasmoidaceae bacterium]
MRNPNFCNLKLLKFTFQNLLFQPTIPLIQKFENSNFQSLEEYSFHIKEIKSLNVKNVLAIGSELSTNFIESLVYFSSILQSIQPEIQSYQWTSKCISIILLNWLQEYTKPKELSVDHRLVSFIDFQTDLNKKWTLHCLQMSYQIFDLPQIYNG